LIIRISYYGCFSSCDCRSFIIDPHLPRHRRRRRRRHHHHHHHHHHQTKLQEYFLAFLRDLISKL
jgi:hypothetical protein